MKEVTEWLDRESSGGEEEEDESEIETPTCSTRTGKGSADTRRMFEGNGTPESGKKESPDVRFGVKRTINSPVSSAVTIKKFLPLKKMKTRKIKRKPVGKKS